MEAKIGAAKDQLYLQIRANHNVHIANKDKAKESSLSVGDYVAGFGKGGSKLIKEGDTPKENTVEFKLHSEKDTVVLNSAMCLVGKVLHNQRQTKPDAPICYHTVDVNVEDPREFSLKQSHRILFNPAEAGAEISASSIATKGPVQLWCDSSVLQVITQCEHYINVRTKTMVGSSN
eukprot:TRINITY_DN42708_c0_g1_i1.p1 TRINITY_DN42708_c0_g1~~TRINITY_DN42708_c0_g1_i1.p1  ORF type:complete len:176 (+),score=39.57 TRINITY_DN42708_c0_g1_i1:546-1073(+)